MIKGAEEALKYFEKAAHLPNEGILPHVAKLFSREEILTKRKKKQRLPFFWNKYFTYSSSFTVIYWGFGLIGAIGLALANFQ